MTKLTTASQARKHIAKDRGYELAPELTSSKTAPSKTQGRNMGGGGAGGDGLKVSYGQYRFQMDHGGYAATSTPQLPPMQYDPAAEPQGGYEG